MVFLFIIMVFLLVIITIGWIIHISMTKENCYYYNWGTYNKFVEYFYNNELQRHPYFKDDYRNCLNNSEVNDGIVKFNGKGMLLNPIDYVRAKLFIYNKKENRKNFKW